ATNRSSPIRKEHVMNKAIVTLVVSVSAASASPLRADTIHVALCGNDAWTGASAVCAAPDGPKRTIQAAINAAVSGRDTVIVADGTYSGPGNRDISFNGRAITVRSENGPLACSIDCHASMVDPHRAFLFLNGETSASVVQGFSVLNGYAP